MVEIEAGLERVFLGLGSNLGQRRANIDSALGMLGKTPGVEVVRVSSFVETEPVGGPAGQGRFLNAAAEVRTDLAPRELLAACLRVEGELGRERRERWGPRTVDVDILLWGARVIAEPGLAVPHPRMHERLFVLAPLGEIAPEAVHSALGRTVGEMRAALGGSGRAQREEHDARA